MWILLDRGKKTKGPDLCNHLSLLCHVWSLLLFFFFFWWRYHWCSRVSFLLLQCFAVATAAMFVCSRVCTFTLSFSFSLPRFRCFFWIIWQRKPIGKEEYQKEKESLVFIVRPKRGDRTPLPSLFLLSLFYRQWPMWIPVHIRRRKKIMPLYWMKVMSRWTSTNISSVMGRAKSMDITRQPLRMKRNKSTMTNLRNQSKEFLFGSTIRFDSIRFVQSGAKSRPEQIVRRSSSTEGRGRSNGRRAGKRVVVLLSIDEKAISSRRKVAICSTRPSNCRIIPTNWSKHHRRRCCQINSLVGDSFVFFLSSFRCSWISLRRASTGWKCSFVLSRSHSNDDDIDQSNEIKFTEDVRKSRFERNATLKNASLCFSPSS